MVFVPVQSISFAFLPANWRVVVLGVADFGYVAGLSWFVHRDQKEEERKEQMATATSGDL